MVKLVAGFEGKSLYAGLALVVVVALVVAVGWVWMGWGYIAQNRWLLKSVPIPPGAERVYVRSGGGYGPDDSVLTPPEGWGTRARFLVSGYTRQEIVDFYISRMALDWEYCLRLYPDHGEDPGSRLVELLGVRFVRGDSIVSIDTSSLSTRDQSRFDIYVDHDSDRNACD